MSNTNYQHQLLKYEPLQLDLPNCDIAYDENFVKPALADNWFDRLYRETNWQQETISLYNKRHLVPRLSCWVADDGLLYGYSKMTMQPKPWTDSLSEIRGFIEQKTGEQFNSVLVNLYRDGQDSNGWHADDEVELGPNPSIASLSLGAVREFDMRLKKDHKTKFRFLLQHGSLLMMRGTTQVYWQHHIPKRANVGRRINLTFRTIRAMT